MDAAVAATEATYGRLDLVHLNAGVTTSAASVEVSDEAYRRLVSVNLDGVFFGLRAALPALRRSGGGVVIATASVGGLAPIPMDPLYGMTKHGVVGLVRSAAPALAAENIRLLGLCPGFTDTRLVADDAEALEAMGFPLMTAETIAAATMRVIHEGQPGECWFVQAGREAQPYGFRGIPGPLPPSLARTVRRRGPAARARQTRGRSSTRRNWLPDGSRNPVSTPYGRSSGSSMESSPRAFSSA